MAEETAPRQEGLFAACTFAIVRSEGLPSNIASEIVKQLELHGGEVFVDNYPDARLDLDHLTHIVSDSFDIPDYYDALDQFIHVVRPAWISASVASQKLVHPRRFSPDPNLFMSDVVATCADLPPGDKDAIAGGILAMGGNYSPKLTALVTHIVALTTDNDKVAQVINQDLNMKVVLPHWFDDCLKLGKRIDEGPYSLPDPEVLKIPADRAPAGLPNRHLAGASSATPTSTSPPSLAGRKDLTVFKNKRVLLDKDLQIGDVLRNVLNGIILTGGGKVVDKVTMADVLICKYRSGKNYNVATANKLDVGNLAWLYYLIVHDIWTSPYRRLLHYPLPKEPLEGFQNLKISLSNYSGEARTYLENLILATGAECTKTLKQENTHLVTAHKKSEKVAAAQDWGLFVVNHLWIEESYAKWHMQAVTNPRYTHFPVKTNLGEVVGQTQIDRKVIEQKFLAPDSEMSDVLPARRKGQNKSKALDNSTPAKANARSGSATKTTAETPATSRVAATGKENVTPGTVGSRASKAAAAAKLHDMTPDIALYEKERKRAGGVVYGGRRKSDADRVEPSRKRSAEPAPVEEAVKKTSKRQKTDTVPIVVHLLVSGYKPWVNQNKKEANETKKLRDMGIAITLDPNKATHVAVPQILRTPKFLKALAYAPKVLSTDYIEACLEADEFQDPEDYILKDKENEKKYSVSLPKALENARRNQGRLLSEYTLYCTEKVQGGIETYEEIAKSNGGSLTPYRGRHMTIPSRRAGSDEDEGPENEVILLTSDSKEDRGLWPKFVKMAEDSRRVPHVLLGEWLLSTALRQELQPMKTYYTMKK